MTIKGMDGQSYNVTGQGQGNFNTVGAAAGIASFLGINGGNILGRNGWGWNAEGVCSDNMPVSRYELNMVEQLNAKDSEIALLKADKYTDQKIVEAYKDLSNKDAQTAVNMQQAVYNGTNTATLQCMQNSIAALQAITKTYIPSSNVCQSDCCGCVSAQ